MSKVSGNPGGGPDAPRRSRRSQAASVVLLLGLLGGALGLRLWYVTALPGQGQDVIVSDMWTYDYTGWQMVRGLPMRGEPGLNGYHPLGASTYYYIGYTYFVAAVYALFGHNPAAVRLTQAVVGAATVGVVYDVGRLCFGRRPGFLAAALTAVYLPLVYYAGLILTETWFIFLQMAAIDLWLRAWGRGPGAESPEDPVDAGPGGRATGPAGGLALAALAGLVAGLACLTRTAFVLALGTLAVGGLWFPPEPASRGSRRARVAAFLLAATAVIAPITVRNYQIHGQFILISTNGPSTFLTGHVTHSSGLPPGLARGTSDAVMAAQHRARAWQYLRRHWDVYLAEIPEFFEIIWTDNDFWPTTSNYWMAADAPGHDRLDIQAHAEGSPPFGRSTYFPDLVRHVDRLVWCLVGLPMGLLAALFLPRRHRRWTVLYLSAVPYLIIPLIAFAFSRYRLPIVPVFFVLAGQSLTACWAARWSRPAAATRG